MIRGQTLLASKTEEESQKLRNVGATSSWKVKGKVKDTDSSLDSPERNMCQLIQ